MSYKIVSPRVGAPGDEYTPTDGINVDALIEGGFIVETTKKNKPLKDSSDTIQSDKE